MIFGINLSTLNVGLMMYGRARWQEAETRKDFNTALIRQDKKFFTSELFKVIEDAIPLIQKLQKVFTKIKETFSLKLLVLTYLYLHPTEKHRDPRFLLLLRNASKHHCLRCRRDPHVNVWRCLSLMMKSCEASRTIAFLAPIFFTMWGTMTPEEILAEHVVDFRRIAADFRDAFERSQTSSTRASGVNKFFTSQAPLQRRLSVYNWNPGPDETLWMP